MAHKEQEVKPTPAAASGERERGKRGAPLLSISPARNLFRSRSRSLLFAPMQRSLRSLSGEGNGALNAPSNKQAKGPSYHLKLLARKVAVSCDGRRHFLFCFSLPPRWVLLFVPFLERSLGPLCRSCILSLARLEARREAEAEERELHRAFLSREMQSNEEAEKTKSVFFRSFFALKTCCFPLSPLSTSTSFQKKKKNRDQNLRPRGKS